MERVKRIKRIKRKLKEPDNQTIHRLNYYMSINQRVKHMHKNRILLHTSRSIKLSCFVVARLSAQHYPNSDHLYPHLPQQINHLITEGLIFTQELYSKEPYNIRKFFHTAERNISYKLDPTFSDFLNPLHEHFDFDYSTHMNLETQIILNHFWNDREKLRSKKIENINLRKPR